MTDQARPFGGPGGADAISALLSRYPSIFDNIYALGGQNGALRWRANTDRHSNGAAQTNDMNAAQSISDAVPRQYMPQGAAPPQAGTDPISSLLAELHRRGMFGGTP